MNVLKQEKTPSSLERFFVFNTFSKRSFAGCCEAKSSIEIVINLIHSQSVT